MVIVATTALASLPFHRCWAHPFDVVTVTLSLETMRGSDVQGAGTVSLDSRASARSNGAAQQEHPDLVVSDIVGEFSLEPSNTPCSISMGQTGGDADQRSLRAVCPGGAAAEYLRVRRHPERLLASPPDLTTIYFISINGRRYTLTLDRDQTERRISLLEEGVTVEMLRMGVRHIGAATEEWLPDSALSLPEGIDHILFVLTLVLASSSLLSLVKTVTGFTLGHSISLAVVTLAKTAVTPSIIEPAIAASIAIMALDATRATPWKRAWIPASLFGLLHGCGFASALLERNLAGSSLLFGLLGFNLGVEIGQLVFVIIFWLSLSLAARITGAQRSVRFVTSVGVFVVATWWFIERVASALR
jgi:hypothetical protein